MKKKTDPSKQDEVVRVLWQFARDQNSIPERNINVITGKDGTRIGLEAAHTALEAIMQAFGYDVVEIQ